MIYRKHQGGILERASGEFIAVTVILARLPTTDASRKLFPLPPEEHTEQAWKRHFVDLAKTAIRLLEG